MQIGTSIVVLGVLMIVLIIAGAIIFFAWSAFLDLVGIALGALRRYIDTK